MSPEADGEEKGLVRRRKFFQSLDSGLGDSAVVVDVTLLEICFGGRALKPPLDRSGGWVERGGAVVWPVSFRRGRESGRRRESSGISLGFQTGLWSQHTGSAQMGFLS